MVAAQGDVMFIHRRLFAAAILSAAAGLSIVPAHAACTSIAAPADFDLIRANLGGNFCLADDIDLAAVGKFKPIGNATHPFTGRFNGNGHALRNLKIVTAVPAVGLFGVIDGAQVLNVRLPGVVIHSTRDNAQVGAVAGQVFGAAKISHVRVSGRVACLGDGCRVGGIAGEAYAGTIQHAFVAAAVIGANGGAAGGIAGQSSGLIRRSLATGAVRCGTNSALGGLVGQLQSGGGIEDSFSSGPVHGGVDGAAGGLVGIDYGSIERSYSTGEVRVNGNSIVASLAGYFGGSTSQVFAAGRVSPRPGSTAGGLVGAIAMTPSPAPKSYWDIDTTQQSASLRGRGLTTAQLQADLPTGFAGPWNIVKGYSYPFLDLADLPYVSTLATIVQGGAFFTFVPIEQLEPSEYLAAPNFAADASLAAVYTMIARAIGYAKADKTLQTVAIDKDFWDDADQKASWAGPVKSYATLSPLLSLDPATPIGDGNIIGPLKSKHVVIIRGHYDAQGRRTKHWMLATLFTTDTGGSVTNLIANDPWTGTQVWIDPTTHQVAQPANFPLTNFTVDGYRVVTLN
jgi:hypothetical protein